MNTTEGTLDKAADAAHTAKPNLFQNKRKLRLLKEQVFSKLILTATLFALGFLFYLLYSIVLQGWSHM
ncbi:MAG: hypothetical protein EOP04_29820, partial [Proteobacteria bacterium]